MRRLLVLHPWHGARRVFAIAFLATGLLAFADGVCKAEQTSSGLSIQIGTQQRFVVGQSFSLVATLTNTTRAVVYLNEEYLRLKVPKELEGPNGSENSFWYGTVPAADPNVRNKENNYHATLSLKPGDSTPVWFFWSGKQLGCAWQEFSAPTSPSSVSCAGFYLFFVPGIYRRSHS
jgi:hypothetical protein